MIAFFLQEHGQSESGKFCRENRPHAMRHVHLAAADLLQRVRNRSDFDMAESFEERSIVVHLGGFLAGFRGRRPSPSGKTREENSQGEKNSAGKDAARQPNESIHEFLQENEPEAGL